MFNSALVYELAVLKLYAEPLLFSIPRDVPRSTDEAKRLLKFLDYFLGDRQRGSSPKTPFSGSLSEEAA